MKKILLLAFLVFFGTAYSQDSVFTNFKLENGEVYFEKVFLIDTSAKIDIERLLTLNVPKVNGVSNYNKTNEVITASLIGNTIDYKKYGGKWGNTWVALNHPYYANLVIVWKKDRYKVTVSDVKFLPRGSNIYLNLTESFTKKSGSMFDHKPILNRAYSYLDLHFSDLFDFRSKENDNW